MSENWGRINPDDVANQVADDTDERARSISAQAKQLLSVEGLPDDLNVATEDKEAFIEAVLARVRTNTLSKQDYRNALRHADNKGFYGELDRLIDSTRIEVNTTLVDI